MKQQDRELPGTAEPYSPERDGGAENRGGGGGEK